MAAPTAGDWTLGDFDSGCVYVWSDSGFIAQFSAEDVSEEECLANARLACATKTLLAACEAVVTACDSAPPMELIAHITRAADLCRAAVTEAKAAP